MPSFATFGVIAWWLLDSSDWATAIAVFASGLQLGASRGPIVIVARNLTILGLLALF